MPFDNNNNNNNVDTELDMIENAMNTMMKGTFSLLFKQLVEPSIFESPSMTTTIINGNNVNSGFTAAVPDDDLGGNDFKRLAQKAKKNRGELLDDNSNSSNQVREMVPATTADRTSNNMNDQGTINPIGSIFNLLLGGDPTSIINQTSMSTEANLNNDDGWMYSSTSQRTIIQPDGSQETVTTTKKNGVTETIKQIKYADGRIEESREEKKSIWQSLWRG